MPGTVELSFSMNTLVSSQLTCSTALGINEATGIVAHHRLPERLRAWRIENPEGSADRHLVSRAFPEIASRLTLGRAHQEFPAGSHRIRCVTHSSPDGRLISAKIPKASCPQPDAHGGRRPSINGCRLRGGGGTCVSGMGRSGNKKSGPASFRGLLPATNTPAANHYSPPRGGLDTGLFKSKPSSSVLSLGTAEANLIVPVAGLVAVAVRRTHVLRVVVPAATTQHPVVALRPVTADSVSDLQANIQRRMPSPVSVAVHSVLGFSILGLSKTAPPRCCSPVHSVSECSVCCAKPTSERTATVSQISRQSSSGGCRRSSSLRQADACACKVMPSVAA